MTITITPDASFKSLDKQGRIYGLSGRGAKLMVVRVATTTDNYVTGGMTASLKVQGIKTIYGVVPLYSDAAVEFRYDKVNLKILMYGSNGAAPAALVELANASTVPNNKVFDFLVIGR